MPKQINPQLVRRLKIFSRFLSSLVFFVGFGALVGWQFNISFLKSIVPSFPIIAPNTAMAFSLGGLTLFFATDIKITEKKFFHSFFQIICSLIAILGFFTLLEYIFGISFGIDRLFFSTAQGASAIRMSPQSAFNFLMVGISLLYLSEQKRAEEIKKGQIIVLLAGAISLLSLFGFIYNISSFYTIAPYKGMAAHTAVAFVMIFLSGLLLHPEYGFMRIFVSRGLSALAARRLFLTLSFVIGAEILATVGRRTNV